RLVVFMPPICRTEPSSGSNRRTDRERALHGPWFSWSSRAISFPAPTSSKVDFSEAWQIPGFHNEVRGLNLRASRRPKAVTRQEARHIAQVARGPGRLTR